LLDGGKDGLFLIVVSLGWWISTQGLSEESKTTEAVRDVTWVIENLVSCLSTDAAAPDSPISCSATPPTQRRKRAGSVGVERRSKCRR